MVILTFIQARVGFIDLKIVMEVQLVWVWQWSHCRLKNKYLSMIYVLNSVKQHAWNCDETDLSDFTWRTLVSMSEKVEFGINDVAVWMDTNKIDADFEFPSDDQLIQQVF